MATGTVLDRMGVLLILDECRGIYIPQDFCQEFDITEWGISEDDANICLAGPDHELYWETWDDILRKAKHKESGHFLWQDGSLFAVNPDLMTDEEKRIWEMD